MFAPSTVGTVLFQWIIAIVLFILLNKIIISKILARPDDS